MNIYRLLPQSLPPFLGRNNTLMMYLKSEKPYERTLLIIDFEYKYATETAAEQVHIKWFF